MAIAQRPFLNVEALVPSANLGQALGTSAPVMVSDQANGMFDLIRYVSVLSTSADLAIWRLRLPLFEESKCRREAC